MSVGLVFSAPRGQFRAAFERKHQMIATAATGAIKDAANQVKRQGRAAIRRAGFSARWQNAFRVDVYPRAGESIDAAAYAHHNIRYAGIFESGGTIPGSPLLWLPLPTAPQRIGLSATVARPSELRAYLAPQTGEDATMLADVVVAAVEAMMGKAAGSIPRRSSSWSSSTRVPAPRWRYGCGRPRSTKWWGRTICWRPGRRRAPCPPCRSATPGSRSGPPPRRDGCPAARGPCRAACRSGGSGST